MSGTFGKFVLPSLFMSGAVFAVLAVPLAVYGSENVDVQLSDTIGLRGTVQDFTAPYLGLVGLASLVVGGATATVVGVSASKKQAEAAEQQYLAAQSNFQARERQLQDALLSESSLMKSGLSFFLDDTQSVDPQAALQVMPSQVMSSRVASDVAESELIAQVIQPKPIVQPMLQPMVSIEIPTVVRAAAPVAQGFTINSSNMVIQPVKVPRVTAQAATSPLHAAHGFMSFARGGQVVTPAAIAWAEETAERHSATQQLETLQSQLQGLMNQIEQLQSSLKTQTVAENTSRIEVIQGDRPTGTVASHRFQPFEHSWTSVPQRVAS